VSGRQKISTEKWTGEKQKSGGGNKRSKVNFMNADTTNEENLNGKRTTRWGDSFNNLAPKKEWGVPAQK